MYVGLNFFLFSRYLKEIGFELNVVIISKGFYLAEPLSNRIVALWTEVCDNYANRLNNNLFISCPLKTEKKNLSVKICIFCVENQEYM